MTDSDINNDISQHAVSLYGQNEGVEDFPVLKAFQQYIDAEQEKARKRIVMLGIFFGAILIVVVAVFLFMLHGINMRNQTLSDRLVEYAMKETERRANVPQPVIQQPSTENAEALKAVTATLAALQESIKKNKEEAAQPVVKSEAEVKIERAKALLEAEKKQIAEERERLRQIEIDRQRRKLYPELYESEYSTQRTRATQGRSGARMLTDEDIREILREAYPAEKETEAKASSKPAAKDDEKKASKKDADADDVSEDSAIEYYKDEEYSIPVDVKGSSKPLNFTVPVGD